MECSCGFNKIKEGDNFCGECGNKLPQIIKEQSKVEIKAELDKKDESTPLDNISTPFQREHLYKNPDQPDAIKTGYDRKVEEYKGELREVLSRISSGNALISDVIKKLAAKAREYSLERSEIFNLQRDVLKELNIPIGEQGHFFSDDFFLEFNKSMAYYKEQMGYIELKITNISDYNLMNFYIIALFEGLQMKTEAQVKEITKSKEETTRLHFNPESAGDEVVKITLNYEDGRGKRSSFKAALKLSIYNKNINKGNANFSINVNAKGSAVDLSHLSSSLPLSHKENVENRSFCKLQEQWEILPFFLDEERSSDVEPGTEITPTSGCLIIENSGKKIFLYSKERITLGRSKEDDMVLRVIPYEPREQHLENWNRSARISAPHGEIIYKSGDFYIRDIGKESKGSKNGTYLNGERLLPLEDYPLRDKAKINIADELEMECTFFYSHDIKGRIDAIKFKRINNYTEGAEYIIIVRSITIGRSHDNVIVLNDEHVSHTHAQINYRNGQYWMTAWDSVTINGKRIQHGSEAPLGKHERIIIGGTEMAFYGKD